MGLQQGNEPADPWSRETEGRVRRRLEEEGKRGETGLGGGEDRHRGAGGGGEENTQVTGRRGIKKGHPRKVSDDGAGSLPLTLDWKASGEREPVKYPEKEKGDETPFLAQKRDCLMPEGSSQPGVQGPQAWGGAGG